MQTVSQHFAIGLLVTAWYLPGLDGQPVLLRLEEPAQHQLGLDEEPSEVPLAAVPGDANRPDFEIRTHAHARSVRGYSVIPGEGVTALVLADSLLEDDWKRIEPELIALRKGLGSQRFLKLAIAAGSALRLSGPFRTASQLRNALRAARPEEPKSANAIARLSEQPTERSNIAEGPDRPNAPAVAESSTEQADEPLRDALIASEVAEIAEARLYQQLGESAAVLGCDWPSVLAVGRLPALEVPLTGAATAYLSSRMRTNRVRFSFVPLDGFVPSAAGATSNVTGGTIVPSVTSYLEQMAEESRFVEVDWTVPKPTAGFHVYSAEIRDTSSGATWIARSAAEAPGWQVPSPLALRGFARRAAELTRAVLGSPARSREWILTEIASLGAINPADESLLRASIQFYQRSEAWGQLADALQRYSEVRPLDSATLANLGTTLVRLQRWNAAELAFLGLKELQPDDPGVSEALGRVSVRLGNFSKALDRFDESLQLDPMNQSLWFYKADTAKGIGDSETQLRALRKGVELPGAPHGRRAQLIKLHLDAERLDEAAREIELGAAQADRNAETLAVYARFWEGLGRPERALELWELAFEANPEHEPAIAASARIHLSQGRHDRSREMARSGIERFPDSARLHLTLAGSLEAGSRFYELREALRAATEHVPEELQLLRFQARVEDLFGEDAPRAYRALAERLAQDGEGKELTQAVIRGFNVSLRQNDMDHARWFGDRDTSEDQVLRDLLPSVIGRQEPGIAVPGGVRALAYMANANDPRSPETVFREYCRPIVYASIRDKEIYQVITRRMELYFETVRALQSLRDGPGEEELFITLSVGSKTALRKTRKALELLGWKLRRRNKAYFLQPVESELGAERQEIGSALEIDGIAIQEALERRQDHKLRIKLETAPLALGEEIWRAELYPNENLSGGFAEAVVRDPRIGAVYIGISQMHPEAARALVESVGLKRLVNRYSDVLLMHSTSLSIEGGAAIVPGGAEAWGLWTNLVGARPDDPDRFLPRLLRKEEGRLLGYFSALGQLNETRRQFFTQSPGRFRQFFELYKASPEFREGGRTKVRESPFLELLRELPLGPDGKVMFPGAAEVWMVAKGSADASRLARKLPRKAVPEVEDEILVRLANTKFQTPRGPRSQVDKFLAASRIDRLRNEPMDAVTALNFAQAFGQFENVFPYFATLTGLRSRHLRSFLAFAGSLESVEPVKRHHLLALFHSLVEILCLGQIQGVLQEDRAAEMFSSMCLGLSKGNEPSVATDTAVDMIEAVLAEADHQTDSGEPDPLIRIVLGVDEPAWRRTAFMDVLKLQSVPGLAVLFQARDASMRVASGKGDLRAPLQSLGDAIRKLPAVEIPKDLKFEDEKKRLMASFGTARLLQAERRLQRAATRRKLRLPELERQSRNVRAELLPHVAAALAGVVYAYYLRPEDLPVAEDPLFLRKHAFFDLNKTFLDNLFRGTYLRGIGEDTGAFIIGGFAGMASAAGQVAKFGLRIMDPDSEALARTELSSLRSTRWRALRDADVRRFALTVLLAREWIVGAAADECQRAQLVRAVAGVLSVSRTRQMLLSLHERNWPALWESFTLSDLYRLGRDRQSAPPGSSPDSPVARALAALPADAESWNRMDPMGSVRARIFGYPRPRMWIDAPYEEYERYLSDVMIAERTAELKLYLVHAADTLGVPVERLAEVAEPVAKRVLSEVQMGDLWDWRSALRTFGNRTRPALREALLP